MRVKSGVSVVKLIPVTMPVADVANWLDTRPVPEELRIVPPAYVLVPDRTRLPGPATTNPPGPLTGPLNVVVLNTPATVGACAAVLAGTKSRAPAPVKVRLLFVVLPLLVPLKLLAPKMKPEPLSTKLLASARPVASDSS